MRPLFHFLCSILFIHRVHGDYTRFSSNFLHPSVLSIKIDRDECSTIGTPTDIPMHAIRVKS